MNFFNMVPIIGWLLAAILCTFIAVPVWLLWNALVPTYFSFLPEVWHSVPYWDTVGLIWLVFSVKNILLPVFAYPRSNKV